MSDSGRNELPGAAEERKRHRLLVELFIRLVKEKPLGTVGGVIVLLMFLTGIFADLTWLGFPEVGKGGPGLAPYGMNEVHVPDRLQGPSPQYILGTDNLGRDQLSRIIFGARISMIVGLAASAICVVGATLIGTISGYLGGKFDLVVQRFVDAWLCFPWLFLILTIMALIGTGLLQVILVLGLIGAVMESRTVRSAVISIKENVYLEAARAVGCPTTRILLRHILPNIMAPIIIIFTVRMGYNIISEASMSFLGFGVPPPNASWGGMISMEGRRYMLMAPHLALWPGLALAIAVYGINMLGDAVRDILDPRLRGGLGRYGKVKIKIAKVKQV